MKSSTSIAGIIAVAAAAAIGLAGCGGSGHVFSSGGDSSPGTTTDAFFTVVSKLIATSPDDTDADQTAFDAAVATAPEDTEPQPLG